MADEKATDKEALKEAEKAAKKAKAERIKQSKPKKEGTVVSRSSGAVKKFFKDFAGTCKKIVWPSGKTVVKNSVVVLVTIIVVGLAVALIDLGLTKLFDLGEKGVVALAEYVGEDETEAETAAGEEETADIEAALSEAAENAEKETEEAETAAEAETEAETAA